MGLRFTGNFFSLEEINYVEGKKHAWERPWAYGWSMLRIGALLRRRSMDDLDRWYQAAGRALHEEGRKPHTPEGAKEILAEIGIDPGVMDEALEDETTHDEVRGDHEAVVNRGGYGVPTLVFEDDTCLFGPVVTPAPTGDAAMRLWDLTMGWREFPHLYEMCRPKTPTDWAHIHEQFRPYMDARDWMTVSNPAP